MGLLRTAPCPLGAKPLHAERITAMRGLSSEWDLAPEESQLCNTNCWGDSAVTTWDWGTGRLCSKSAHGSITGKSDEGTRTAPASSRSACSKYHQGTLPFLVGGSFSVWKILFKASQAFKRKKKLKSQTGSLNYKGFVWKLPDLPPDCDQGCAKSLVYVTLATVLNAAKKTGSKMQRQNWDHWLALTIACTADHLRALAGRKGSQWYPAELLRTNPFACHILHLRKSLRVTTTRKQHMRGNNCENWSFMLLALKLTSSK